MKKAFKLGLLALFGAGSLVANDISRSYFNVRSYQPPIMTQNLMVDQATETGRALRMTGLEASVFYGQSTEAKELAKYFFFDGKDELVVREDVPNTDALQFSQDVLSLNFNVNTTGSFHSTIKVRPKQTFYGVGLSGRMHFRDKFWVAVEAPIVHVKNNMNLTENVINAGGGAATGTGMDSLANAATMVDGFKQAGMKFGKIDGAQSKTALADLTFKLGYDCPRLNRKDLFMNLYGGIVLPTGNKPKAVYMFEPICGNGAHTAFMFGTHGEIHSRKFKDGDIWFSWGAQSQYLFENTQARTLDLKLNGPWSRYLSMFETAAKRTTGGTNSATFGVNLLTQQVKVTPGYTGTFDAALHYVGPNFYGNVGYTTFMRQAEKVELANSWKFTEATVTAYDQVGNHTNRFRRIGKALQGMQQTTTANSVAIKEEDLDLGSAAHPATVSFMLQGAVGYHNKCENRPYVIETGGNYEFSRQNTALNRWGIFGKVRVSF